MWDRFFDLDNVVWRTIDKNIFIESALADLFPAGVYDRGIDDRPDLHQHEAFGQ